MKGSKSLLIILFSTTLVFAENDSLRLQSLENELSVFQTRIDHLLRTQRQIQKDAQLLQLDLVQLENRRDSLNEEVSAQIADNRAMMDDFSARQVQTERALNLALDQFQEKFEDQNRVAAQLEAQLKGQVNYQLIIMVAAFAALMILFIFLNRSSVRRSLVQTQGSWNQFQDYFLKNN